MKLPEQYCAAMRELLGEAYGDYLESFGKSPKNGIRVNERKLSPEQFLKITKWDLKEIPWISNGFYYEGAASPARHPHYYAGLYYLQEPSAMTPGLPSSGGAGRPGAGSLRGSRRKSHGAGGKTEGKRLPAGPMISALRAQELFLKIWSWRACPICLSAAKLLKNWRLPGRKDSTKSWWTPPVPGRACFGGTVVWRFTGRRRDRILTQRCRGNFWRRLTGCSAPRRDGIFHLHVFGM